jgi:hypothetical protein
VPKWCHVIIQLMNSVSFLFQVFIILLWSAHLSYAQEKINYEELQINKSFCFDWEFLVNVPQYERSQGKPYLDDELVIDSQESYLNFQKKSIPARTQACTNVDFPPIDFSQRTLIAKYASGSCAGMGFKREVLKDNIKKEIIYSVKAIERNIACSGPGLESMNLITIPKVPKDYKVVFSPSFDTSGYQSYTCKNGKMIARDWNGNIVSPRNSPPPGGGVFGVQMDCGNDKMDALQERWKNPELKKYDIIVKLYSMVPPPCPEDTYELKGKYGVFCSPEVLKAHQPEDSVAMKIKYDELKNKLEKEFPEEK